MMIQKTVQVPKFEPVNVSISETYAVSSDTDMDVFRRTVTRKIGAAVEAAIDREIKRYE